MRETTYLQFEDDVEIDPKARVIIDVIKFVSYVVVVVVAGWSDLVRAMVQGVFFADAMIWFIAMLHQFSQRIYLGFAEAAGYLVVFILFVVVGGGPALPKDQGLFGLTILMFMTTFVIKGTWAAYRKLHG